MLSPLTMGVGGFFGGWKQGVSAPFDELEFFSDNTYASDDANYDSDEVIPMTMADWSSKLDVFLKFNDADILQNKGKVTSEIAKAFAESEFEKYRVIQDRLYESDFDRTVKLLISENTFYSGEK